MVSIFDGDISLRLIIERMSRFECVVCGKSLKELGTKPIHIYLCFKHRREYLDEITY